MKRLVLVLLLLITVEASAQATQQGIELETPTGVIKGALTLPTGATPVPVALLIAGSGPTDRDGNTPAISGRNDSLKMLSVALAESGVASVRFDKRGIAASSGAARSEADLRFDDYIQDAVSWVEKLSKDSRFQGIAVIGHSEGSLIGMLTSQRSPVRAFISIAGPAERAPVVLRRQLQGRLPPDLAQRNEEILRSLESGSTVTEVPPPLYALYRQSVQPYLVSWFRYSPKDEFAKLRIPCLLLQGTTDLQVEVADAKSLHTANPSCLLKVVEGMNHVLKRVPADQQRQISSYGDPLLPLDSELVNALAGFFSSDQVQAALRAQR